MRNGDTDCVPAYTGSMERSSSPLNYHPNYKCITLHTCSWMVNKYSHIISTSEWKQRLNTPTGDTDGGGPVGPNLVWTQPSLMWVNHGKGSFSFSGFKKCVNVFCNILRLISQICHIRGRFTWKVAITLWSRGVYFKVKLLSLRVGWMEISIPVALCFSPCFASPVTALMEPNECEQKGSFLLPLNQ